jgi:hypothetical protein
MSQFYLVAITVKVQRFNFSAAVTDFKSKTCVFTYAIWYFILV